MMVISFLHWIFAAACAVAMPLVTFQLLEGGLLVSGLLYGLLTLLVWRFIVGWVVALPVLWYTAFLLTRHKHLQAQKMLRRVVRLWRILPLSRDMIFLTLQSNLALSYLACGDNHHAESVYDEIVAHLERRKRLARSPLAGVFYNNVACLHLYNRDYEAAESLAEKALAIWRSAGKNEPGGCAYPLANLLEVYLVRGELERCNATADEVLVLCTQAKQPAQVVPESRIGVYIQALLFKAVAVMRLGQKELAEQIYNRILLCHEQGMTPPFNYSVTGLRLLATEVIAVGDSERAEALLDLGYEILREHPFHTNSAELLEVYEKLLIESGRADEVSDLKNWVRPGRGHLLKAAL